MLSVYELVDFSWGIPHWLVFARGVSLALAKNSILSEVERSAIVVRSSVGVVHDRVTNKIGRADRRAAHERQGAVREGGNRRMAPSRIPVARR